MRQWTWVIAVGLCGASFVGCAQPPTPYGRETPVALRTERRQVWAVAPAINLSGYDEIDPLLQADLLYQQLQQVGGLTVIPVNRTAEVYSSLRIMNVDSEEQAAVVCDLLGCDALVVATVTAFDPYNPPKFGASLQLFAKPGSYARPANVDPRELSRQAAPAPAQSLPRDGQFIQAVGMFDAANGSVRDALMVYASGRSDPVGPLGAREYLVSMDRYCGFVYHELILEVLDKVEKQGR
ncbi:MAG: hypothetical protein ACREJC_00800 [Tepidisphaeraceae bacterium]